MITDTTIKEIIGLIAEEYGPEKIILFGSYARGTADSDSDLDLLVISDKERHLPRRKRGLTLLYRLRKFHLAKDILIYTQDEVDRWKEVRTAFVSQALREGIVIYGS
jgi:predicted nucleotidyltransferase